MPSAHSLPSTATLPVPAPAARIPATHCLVCSYTCCWLSASSSVPVSFRTEHAPSELPVPHLTYARTHVQPAAVAHPRRRLRIFVQPFPRKTHRDQPSPLLSVPARSAPICSIKASTPTSERPRDALITPSSGDISPDQKVVG
ncbi:hypothetical protein FKP32DRAFT_1118292 [Trametes sanguinea]|nr:hypothetical protein FKP32DRAFT_1118292 [Trametes sanguinea]